MARAQSISSKTKIFDASSDGKASKFFVGCNPSSVNPADVFIKGIHHDGNPFPLYADTGFVFEGSIHEVWITPVGGTTLIDSGVVAR